MMYNLKITFRNLTRAGVYTIINIIGLAISLTVCILLALWIQDELSYDKFHKKASHIYAVNSMLGSGGQYWTTTPAPLAIHAKAEFPGIEKACRTGSYGKGFFEYENEKYHNLQGLAADTTFFLVFDFPLIEGDPQKPFTDDMSIIVTETLAKTIFGDERPIGKTLKSNDGMLFHITGIVKDPPRNSSMRFQYLVPFDVQQKTFTGNGNWKVINEDWGSYSFRTYFLLNDPAEKGSIEEKVSNLVTKILEGDMESSKYNFALQPLLKVHLFAPSGEPQGMKTVQLFITITVLILLIACINYVNLVTARATKRSREIAMRKILGADKKMLFFQLMRETLLLLIPALIIATLLIYSLMPVFNQLSGKSMIFSFGNLSLWLIYSIMTISVLLLAGVYPALFLASFEPMEAFRAKASGKKSGRLLRKTLVVIQFIFSFGLIAATITINMQMKYMREKDLGYEKENIFTLWAGNMGGHYDAVKTELLNNTDILGVTAADHGSMMVRSSRYGADWPGKPDDFDPVFYQAYVQNNFLDVMGMELLAGEAPSPADTFVLYVNETAAKTMEMDNPVGQPFYFNKGSDSFETIKGVVKDYNFESLHANIKPLLLIFHPGITHVMYIKTTGTGAANALSATEEIWKEYNPDYQFSYSFLDETFGQIYREQLRVERLFAILAVIAIFISCLGMFGLITYTAETKTKEIGIRKVLGATIGGIITMLSKEFMFLITIAMAISIPLSYYWLDGMLKDYVYRISLSWWIFLLAVAITVALTLLTIVFQAVKAATANPVKSLKNYE